MNAMISGKVESIIERSSFFKGVDDETLAHLKETAKLKAYIDGQQLTREGDDTKDVFIISRGAVEVKSHVGDEEVLLATLGPSDIVGEVSAAMNVPRTSTVTAVEMVEAVMIPYAIFAELLARYPDVKGRILDTVSARALAAMKKIQV